MGDGRDDSRDDSRDLDELPSTVADTPDRAAQNIEDKPLGTHAPEVIASSGHGRRGIRDRMRSMWGSPGIHDELFTGVLVGVLALIGVATASLTYFGIEGLQANVARGNLALAEKEHDNALTLERLKAQQEVLTTFADSIPRNKNIALEYKRRQAALHWGHDRATDAPESSKDGAADNGRTSQPHQYGARVTLEAHLAELGKEWRTGTFYLTACQLVEVRFDEAGTNASRLRDVFDLLTDMNVGDVHDAHAELVRIVKDEPISLAEEELESGEADVCGQGIQDQWKQKLCQELYSCQRWLKATARPDQRRPPQWEAAIWLQDALGRTIDMLYLSTMQDMKAEITSTAKSIKEQRKSP